MSLKLFYHNLGAASSDAQKILLKSPHIEGMKRTLLCAGTCALMAMAFVPVHASKMPLFASGAITGSRAEYQFIFALEPNAQINVAKLVVTVCFAAVAGALWANLPKKWATVSAGIAAVFAAGGICYHFHSAAIRRAESDEAYARAILRESTLATEAALDNAARNRLLGFDLVNYRRLVSEKQEIDERERPVELSPDQKRLWIAWEHWRGHDHFDNEKADEPDGTEYLLNNGIVERVVVPRRRLEEIVRWRDSMNRRAAENRFDTLPTPSQPAKPQH